MKTVRFMTKRELKKATPKDLLSLFDSSKRFHEAVVEEYYDREAREVNQALKELRQENL